MSQQIIIGQFQSNSASTVQATTVLPPTEKLIVLYETGLTSAEKQCIYSVCGVDCVCEVDSKFKTQSISDLITSGFTALLIDMRDSALSDWYLENRNYIASNFDKIKVVYKKKTGETIEDDDKKTLKVSFALTSVKKYLPDYAKNFADYLSKVSSDHVSSHVVKLNKIEKLWRLIKCCFGI